MADKEQGRLAAPDWPLRRIVADLPAGRAGRRGSPAPQGVRATTRMVTLAAPAASKASAAAWTVLPVVMTSSTTAT
ncbi:hypothetical protein G6F66_014764 [Rhizopus arrhizus]|nr:hypothetical protein G6F65_021683 [Rhizopus arrhizus]KAG1256926.1 hypothetical protein G6F66_014764 [Rhizopus arrhizus]